MSLNLREKPEGALLQEARRMAKDYTRCPNCGSQNIRSGVGDGLAKPKPYVDCEQCGALLAWG